jgi:ribosomal protein S4
MKAIKHSVSQRDSKPKAWIVNPKDRGRKSIKKDNKIYLKDGQNFEIELFNPLTDSVLTDIRVNGKSVSSTGLVIRPGERFYIDCFIDDKKKFVFKTYDVENTNESKKATSSNGLIEVFFYKEETVKINNWREVFIPVIERHYYPVYYPWYRTIWYTNTVPFNITTSGTGTITVPLTTLTVSNSSNSIGFTTTSSGTSNTSNYYSNSIEPGTINSASNYYSNSIETGRIEKGQKSEQKFSEIDMNFEKYHITSVMYQILPESQKPIETKEIKKEVTHNNFCSKCGRKSQKDENFCSQCGNKLKVVDVVLV